MNINFGIQQSGDDCTVSDKCPGEWCEYCDGMLWGRVMQSDSGLIVCEDCYVELTSED